MTRMRMATEIPTKSENMTLGGNTDTEDWNAAMLISIPAMMLGMMNSLLTPVVRTASTMAV